MKVLTILPVLIGALVLIVIGVSWWINTPDSAGTASRYNLDYTDADTVASGKTLYTQHCAACHGKSLEGKKIGVRNCPTAGYLRHRTMRAAIPGIIRTNSYLN